MSGNSAAVLKPRSEMDRKLARLEQIAVWNYVSKSVEDDATAISRAEELAIEAYRLGFPEDDTATQPSPTIKLRAISVAADLMRLAHQIRKETFHDRTIPVLARIEASAATANLPPAPEEVEAEQNASAAAASQSGPEQHGAAVLAALREAVAVRAIGIVRPADKKKKEGANGSGA